MNIPASLTFHPRLLLGPGPSNADPRVLEAMAKPVVGHLDPHFLAAMAEVQEMLRGVFRTKNKMTFALSATGTAGMECCLVNLIEPGDRVVVATMGYFGERMAEIAARCGAELTVIKARWGTAFDLDQIRETLKSVRPKVLGLVHAETSTGVEQPIEQLGTICRELDVLSIVDAVTSLGCTPLEVDAWGIDAAFSCSQKGLSCPPGLAPVTLGERALAALHSRQRPVQSWYFDLRLLQNYWGQDRAYHHTGPINMVFALHEGLRIVLSESHEARAARHRANHTMLRAGLNALRLNYFADSRYQLPQINAVYIPANVDDREFRARLLERHKIEIGGGLGDLKGKVWRIGLMGVNSQPQVVFKLLDALEQELLASGCMLTPGEAVAAAKEGCESSE